MRFVGVFVLLYLFLYILIGFWMSRRNKTMDDHMVAGRKMPMPIAGASMAANMVGTGVTLGVAEIAYKDGITGVFYPLLLMVALAVSMWIASHRFRASNHYTLPEMMGTYFGPKTRMILGIANSLKWIGPIAAQYLAAGVAVKTITGWDLKTTIILSALAIMTYVILGGLWAVAVSNLIQLSTVYVGLVIMFFAFHFEFGGFSSVLSMLPENYSDPFAAGSIALTAWIGVVVGLGFVDQVWLQVSAAVRTPRDARNAGVLATFLVIPVGFLSVYLGLVSRIELPGIDPKMALPELVIQNYPNLFGSLFVAAILAAAMSTDAWIQSAAVMLTQDTYHVIRKDATERELNRFLNFATIGIGLAGLGIALLWKGGIVMLVMASLMLGSSVYIAPLLVQWFAPTKFTQEQGFRLILFLMVVGIILMFAPKEYWFGVHPILSLGMLGYLVTLIRLWTLKSGNLRVAENNPIPAVQEETP